MKWIVEFLQALVMAVMPRPQASEELHVYRWRQTVALAILALATAQTIHIILACGLIPQLSTGFAQAATLDTIVVQQNTFEQTQFGDQLIRAMERYCDAKSNETRRFRYETILGLQNEYARVSGGKHYILPTCEQLGATG